jgi:hypothetical protein
MMKKLGNNRKSFARVDEIVGNNRKSFAHIDEIVDSIWEQIEDFEDLWK